MLDNIKNFSFRCTALFLIIFYSSLFSFEEEKVRKKILEGCPEWMYKQIERDLKPHQNKILSFEELNKIFSNFPSNFYIVRFKIKDNLIFIEKKFKQSDGVLNVRLKSFKKVLNDLSKIIKLPDVSFFITLHDGLNLYHHDDRYYVFPLFAMSRAGYDPEKDGVILLPDFEALNESYQVLKKENIINFECPWDLKKPILMWRGSYVQSSYDTFTNVDTESNLEKKLDEFTRFTLCNISNQFPYLINAKLTLLPSDPAKSRVLQPFFGDKISYQEQCSYKYHILINGNAASYRNSGWRFFINSIVFIPDSGWVQWYFSALEPYIHYIPVQRRLEDLVEKVLWAQEHDRECEEIAKNARKFARTHLTRSDHLVYFYYLLDRYSKLNFVD